MKPGNSFNIQYLLKKLIGLIILLSLHQTNSFSQSEQTFTVCDQEVTVVGDLQSFHLDVEVNQLENDLEIATLRLTSPIAATPPQFSLKWKIPSINVAGYWSSNSYTNKTIRPDWYPSKVKSMLAREAPMITLFGHDGSNRSTFAVSEVRSTVVASTSIREEDGMIYNEIIFFTEPHRKLKTYEVMLRIDQQSIHFSQAIQNVSNWWATFDKNKPITVPEHAKLPVYSTWYSYHQNVSSDALIRECEIAKKMGFESIIIDDGWQTLDENRGYAFTGDWEPVRIPEMKALVQKIHDIGMKFILWYAIPFVGEKSNSFEQMQGKFLRYWNGQGAYVLDPRFPEVREFIIDTYVRAMTDWNLDGFKLDFIARFSADENTVLEAIDGRDFASVNEATDALMTELVTKLKEIKPDVLIEFRQPYTGPAMRKFGNMFRAGDCPNLAMINRVRTTDLRLLSGQTAVHSDMLMWHYDEPVEIAALQLLNVMFSVPQISVRLEDIPRDHFKMIQFYLSYWRENRNILLEGNFQAHQPLLNYTSIEGRNDRKRIVAVFDNRIIELDSDQDEHMDLINATTSTKLSFDVKRSESNLQVTIYNCLGEIIERKQMTLKPGLCSFNVPTSGLLTISRL